jgi:pSer/pThr/pTyr-binding forkhead associated (FHA) protein
MSSDIQRTLRISQLGHYREDCKHLDLQSFVARHGEAFLLHFGPIGKLTIPEKEQNTMTVESTTTRPGIPFNPQADFLVFPVRGASGERPLSVGRTADNSIAIPDVSLSTFHAAIFKDAKGELLILDAGSKNGTFVEDQRVPLLGQAEGVRLVPGHRVRFGNVDVSFLRTDEFRTLVNQLLG